MFTLIPLFPGLPGGPELLIVLLIVILLFGANKLPELARSSGQAMGEFRRGRQEIEEELQEGAQPDDEEEDETVTTTDTATESVETEEEN
ncbi:twin-arginine translocase TatA/TatE family subunit [Haloferax sp. S1W]|uniref:twin-arginine translocase TatA/TatE family subunit n=1 Tax=Haloferax sp. S1W TaxID=3377110 RepID=UPI0037C8A8F2